MAVDIQRNRIVATAVLKEAESLADQGKICANMELYYCGGTSLDLDSLMSYRKAF